MSYFVPRVEPKSRRHIEEEAAWFLRKHFPERLSEPGRLDVLELWELLGDEYGLQPGVDDLSDGTEGMTWPDGRVFVSEDTYRGVVKGEGRARFTMCHESYHGLKHRNQIRNVLVDTGDLVLYRRSELSAHVDPEWQANVFAASVLMPWTAVGKVLAEACDKSIEDMMYFFGVSKTAASIRIKAYRSWHAGQL